MDDVQRCGSCERVSYIQRVLAVILIAAVLATYVLQPPKPAKAFVGVGVITVTAPIVASVIAKALIAAGITVASAALLEELVDRFQQAYPDFNVAESLEGGMKLVEDVQTRQYKAIVELPGQLWEMIREFVDDNFDAGINSISNVGLVDLNNVTSYQILYEYGIVNGLPITVTYHDGSYDFNLVVTASISGSYVYVKKTNLTNGNVTNNNYLANKVQMLKESPDSMTMWVLSGNSVKVAYGINYPFTGTYTGESISGEVVGESVCDDVGRDWVNDLVGTRSVSVPLTKTEAAGAISLGNDVYDGDKEAVIADLTGVSADAQVKTYEDVIAEDLTGVPVAMSVDIPTVGVIDNPALPAEGAESETSLQALLFSKFPFCLPWDLMNAINLLSADPVTPKFEFDLVPQGVKDRTGMTGNTKIVFDMGEYEWIGQVSRWSSLIGFCIALILQTRKIIHS